MSITELWEKYLEHCEKVEILAEDLQDLRAEKEKLARLIVDIIDEKEDD